MDKNYYKERIAYLKTQLKESCSKERKEHIEKEVKRLEKLLKLMGGKNV